MTAATNGVSMQRRGGAYVAVLGLALLATVVGLGGLAVVNSQSRAAELSAEAAEARSYAASGIELARWIITSTPDWRGSRGNGTWIDGAKIGDGTVSVDVENPSGDMDRSEKDPVVVTATGIKGDARQILRVTLSPDASTLSCLDAAVCAGSTINWGTSSVQAAGQVVATNGSMIAGGGTINANAEAAGSITGMTFSGTQASPVAARTMPGSSVLNHYIANGTVINFASLPSARIRRVLLSPANNPFGATNAQGIYIINCGGSSIEIREARIVGTLVLIDPGASSAILESVHWSAAVVNYPCLLVSGSMSFGFTSTALSESGAGVNFNPSGTPYPYPAGVTNSSQSDTYPSRIQGLVYVSGNATTTNVVSIGQLVVGGTLTASGTLRFSVDSTYLSDPPPGFYSAPMSIEPGSWTRVVDP